MLNTDFNIIFWFILGVITLGAAVMATLTLIKVIRLRNVRLSWKTGKMQGYPLFSTLFLASAFLVGAIAAYSGSLEEMIIAALFGWLGLCWFTASFFIAKRFITDHGIVKNVNEPSQTVAWHQILDFVEDEDENGCRYIFIYYPDEHACFKECNNLIRLELYVPWHHKKAFQKLISHKLGSRIRCYLNEGIDVHKLD
ncbi:MAG TPA: hypothetical protein VFG39_02325 [Balneolaceae bacterium]|nr:hypothetical protein [Balneolaceae bacterium]